MRNQVAHPNNRLFEDLTGHRFGMLTVLFYVGRYGNNAAWRARCDCGRERDLKSTNMKRMESCGCKRDRDSAIREATHGATRNGTKHPTEYVIWDGIKRRCRDTGHHAFKWYGGAGITICDRWLNGGGQQTGYECFLSDMGPRPSMRHSVDRFPDKTGNYEPGNCRWATWVQQARNKTNNFTVEFRGRVMTMAEAIELSGLKDATVRGRLHLGWSPIDALTLPPQRPGRRHRPTIAEAA